MSDKGFTSQKLNLTLAICAILISIASFYATFLQANAAEKQVKAMTLPLLQYETSNVDGDTREIAIVFTIENGGVGPAIIKSLSYQYKDTEFNDILQVLAACCQKEVSDLNSHKDLIHNIASGGWVTSSIVNTILPVQQKVDMYKLYHGDYSQALWNKLNKERRYVSVDICYCSLLDECYVSNGKGKVAPVAACAID